MVVLFAVVIGVGAAACRSGGDDDAGESGGAGKHTAPTSSTRAPTDQDDVAIEIDQLLGSYGEAVSRIVADPKVARDRDAGPVRSYLDLFEPGNQIAAGAVQGWVGMADQGTTIKPINDQHPAVVLRLDGSLEVVSPDEVHFDTCEEHRYLQFDARGNVQDLVRSTLQHGQGVAVRTDGQWRLRDLKTLIDGQGCKTLSEGP